jgi:Polysaccharide biosynthesis protein
MVLRSTDHPQRPTKQQVLELIEQLVPAGSPEPQDPQILHQLQNLCQDLIAAYGLEPQHSCSIDEIHLKSVHLYEQQVSTNIAGKVILVTGGAGCIGSFLIEKLLTFAPAKIISVDIAYTASHLTEATIPLITKSATDVGSYEALQLIFEQEKPQIVFHLAAQRDPGLAELTGPATLKTNVFGTVNIIRLCEEYAIQKCIVASTGKASRYFTPDIYACSKKMNECLLTQAAQEGKVIYGAVRFTHVVDNSLVTAYVDQKISESGVVRLHAPERYIYGQNRTEAVHLLLNGLVFAQPQQLHFLTVRDLGWPIEILEMSLQRILSSGKKIPLYFQGLPSGYEEFVFAGNYNWAAENVSPMVNFIEAQAAIVDQAGDMIIWPALRFADQALASEIISLQDCMAQPSLTDKQVKTALGKAVENMMQAVFDQVPGALLQEVLTMGLNPSDHLPAAVVSARHAEIVNALTGAIEKQPKKLAELV